MDSPFTGISLDQFREMVPSLIGRKISASWNRGKEERSATLSNAVYYQVGDFRLEFTDAVRIQGGLQAPDALFQGHFFGEDTTVEQSERGSIVVEEYGFSLLIHPPNEESCDQTQS